MYVCRYVLYKNDFIHKVSYSFPFRLGNWTSPKLIPKTSHQIVSHFISDALMSCGSCRDSKIKDI